MPSLTLKGIPESLLDRLRERARADRRSLTQEALYLLEAALDRPPGGAEGEAEARAQAASWSRLAGRWRSELSAEEEIGQILASRTRGRDTEL